MRSAIDSIELMLNKRKKKTKIHDWTAKMKMDEKVLRISGSVSNQTHSTKDNTKCYSVFKEKKKSLAFRVSKIFI